MGVGPGYDPSSAQGRRGWELQYSEVRGGLPLHSRGKRQGGDPSWRRITGQAVTRGAQRSRFTTCLFHPKLIRPASSTRAGLIFREQEKQKFNLTRGVPLAG